jgi:hypothetical protein
MSKDKNDLYDFIDTFCPATRWNESPHVVLNNLVERFSDQYSKDELIDILFHFGEFAAEQSAEWRGILHRCVECAHFLGEYNDLPSLIGRPFCELDDAEWSCNKKVEMTDELSPDELLKEYKINQSLTNEVKLNIAINKMFP